MPIQRSPLQYIQRQRKTYIIICVIIASIAMLLNKNYWQYFIGPHSSLLFYSISFVAIAIMGVGRIWATTYIAGYKKEKLITTGPYSLNRNPLYHFSLIGVFGVGLISGSFIIAVSLTLAIFLIFNWVIQNEEYFLKEHFGQDYHNYCVNTPRWGCKIRDYNAVKIYEDTGQQNILLWRTAREAFILILIIPIHYAIHFYSAIPLTISLP